MATFQQVYHLIVKNIATAIRKVRPEDLKDLSAGVVTSVRLPFNEANVNNDKAYYLEFEKTNSLTHDSFKLLDPPSGMRTIYARFRVKKGEGFSGTTEVQYINEFGNRMGPFELLQMTGGKRKVNAKKTRKMKNMRKKKNTRKVNAKKTRGKGRK